MSRGSVRPFRSAASIELQDLKMTTVGGLLKEMKEAGGTIGMSGVRGDGQAEATVVCYAVGEDAQALVDAFLALRESMAKSKGYSVVTNGELPAGPQGEAPALSEPAPPKEPTSPPGAEPTQQA